MRKPKQLALFPGEEQKESPALSKLRIEIGASLDSLLFLVKVQRNERETELHDAKECAQICSRLAANFLELRRILSS